MNQLLNDHALIDSVRVAVHGSRLADLIELDPRALGVLIALQQLSDIALQQEGTLMGYMHYWHNAVVPYVAWLALCGDARSIVREAASRQIAVVTCMVTPDEIFISEGDDPARERLEVTRRVVTFAAVSSNRNAPYDPVVCAILISLAHHGDAYVSSDGDVDDWQPGVELYRHATGRTALPERGPWVDAGANR